MRPVSDTVDFGSDYTVTCNDGYTSSSTEAMSCTANGKLDVEHTCDSKPLNYLPLLFIENSQFDGKRRAKTKLILEGI